MSSALDRLAKRGVSAPGERGIDIPLAKIRFDPTQPRKAYRHLDGRVAEKDEAYIEELAQTIEENGLIQAITVQEMGDGTYLVVVGECRTRAHLLLGKETIRAVVRNDLTNTSRRLLYQIVENVTRQKLTDQELAESIQKLKEGGDGMEPMTQVQIAKTLGKSEGWVSRFVKYGDEELQRLWVKSGIADSVEHLYRLSILPSAMQVDIRRRVELQEDDPEWLAKPLGRDTIDKLTKEAKLGKAKKKGAMDVPHVAPVAPVAPVAHAAPVQSSAPVQSIAQEQGAAPGDDFIADVTSAGSGGVSGPGSDGWTHSVNGVAEGKGSAPSSGAVQEMGDGLAADVAAQAQALSAAVVDAHGASQGAGPSAAAVEQKKYFLPEEARAAILGSTGLAVSPTGVDGKVEKQAPVNCRVPMGSVVALLDVLNSNSAMKSAVNVVQCDLNIPGALAQLIANELAGMIVDQKEVASLMQRELVRLGQTA